MENLAASSSQQPPKELVQEVMALEARRDNLEATLVRMGSVEDSRPRPSDPEVPRHKVLILDLTSLLLRAYREVDEAERAREFGHHLVSPDTRRIIYVPRVGVSGFLEVVGRDFTLIICVKFGHRGRAATRTSCSTTWRSVVSFRVVSSKVM
ncbi:hypothetical protein R1flu_001728 [Riccia fluitans]|uniref:Uncharacterized protein n=1 Tax=Riccia fluitans TaxID=41844 RepID=A0ABD1Y432_9MARC